MPVDRVLISRRVSAGALALAAMGCLALVPQQARAQSCHVNGAFGMDFGTVTSSGRGAVSSLTYTCAPDYSGSNSTYSSRPIIGGDTPPDESGTEDPLV